ncbi:co-chaperone GroES [Candidatus Gracilibacteria bacterium 28_42_T64]|nr:co-chaperone GroES [Candidatus Gracilibacteria bacterium 28_42_T64]
MGIKPLADRVLLKAVTKENVTASGIYLPESANKERSYMYEVVAVGAGKKDIDMSVKIGDKVLSGQYSGDDVKVDGNEYKIVAMDYILAIVE